MFTRNLMRHGAVTANKHVNHVVTLLNRTASTNQTIDLQDVFFKMTIDVFSEIAFGVDLQSVLAENPTPFAAAFDQIQAGCHKRFSDPFWRLQRFLQSCERERMITAKAKIINTFAENVINSRRRDAELDNKLGPDLLSRFLDKSVKDGNGEMTSKQLRDIVMNFMIAGRDTTACAMSWSIYELTKNPECAERIIAEVESVMGDRLTKGGNGGANADADADADADAADGIYEKIGELKYTHSVITEVLRLHPSVPTDLKYAVQDDTLPDGTKILAGATVIYSPYAINRDKVSWGKDADEFNPSRFFDKLEPSTFKYPTFNAGPRLCLGKNLAYLELKLALAVLLTNFRFAFEEGNVHKGGYACTLVLPMKPALNMTVTRR